MEHKTKRDLAIINLVAEFESKCDRGSIGYLEEKNYQQLIYFYEDEMHFDKALEVVDYAIKQYAYRSEFYTLKARLLLKLNDIEEAIDLLDIAETIAPFELEVRILKAKALIQNKVFNGAIEILEDLKSYANNGDLAEIYVCESYLHEAMDDFEKMFKSLEQALIIDPSNLEALNRIWFSVELSRKFKDSIALHKSILDRDPYSYHAWYNLGHAYACTGEYDLAISSMEYSFIINEDFEAGYIDCADLCFQTRKYRRSLELYKELNERFGPDPEYLFHQANCQFELGAISKAKRTLFKSLKFDPFNDEVYYLIAKCYVHQKNWINAINAYEKAINIEDRREEYYAGLAKVFVEIGDFQKALKNFKQSTEIGREESIYWEEYVSFLFRQKNYTLALEVINDSEDYTYSPKLLYQKAVAHFALNKKSKTKRLLEEALMEDYRLHKVIKEYLPGMLEDPSIRSMITYFKGEQVHKK